MTQEVRGLYWYYEARGATSADWSPRKAFGEPETKDVDGKTRLIRVGVTGPLVRNIKNIPKSMNDATLDELFSYFNTEPEKEYKPPQSTPMHFMYTNHKGITGLRQVVIDTIYFGVSSWYQTPQWLINGYDCDRGEDRTFALNQTSFMDVSIEQTGEQDNE